MLKERAAVLREKRSAPAPREESPSDGTGLSETVQRALKLAAGHELPKSRDRVDDVAQLRSEWL